MNRQIKPLALLAGIVFLGVRLEAAETKTFEVLVHEAIAANPEIAYFEARIAEARAEHQGAGLRQPASLYLQAGGKSSSDPTGLAGEGLAFQMSAMQTFEWPGRIALRKAVASYDIRLAALGLEQFKADLAGRVRLGAWRVAAAGRRQAAASEVQKRFSELRDVLVQRDPAGIAPALELRVIDATELVLRKKVTDADVTLKAARTSLNVLRGRRPDEEIDVTSAVLKLHSLPAMDLLVRQSWTNNFSIRARAMEFEQQGIQLDLAHHERRPAISAGPVFVEEHSLGVDRIVALAVSFPLPLKKHNRVQTDVAEARMAQARAAMASAQREVEGSLLAKAVAYETVLQELNHWRDDTLEEFAQAAAQADRHYRLGAVPVTTYVELQQQYLDAVISILELQEQAMEMASELDRLTGVHLGLIELVPVTGKIINPSKP